MRGGYYNNIDTQYSLQRVTSGGPKEYIFGSSRQLSKYINTAQPQPAPGINFARVHSPIKARIK